MIITIAILIALTIAGIAFGLAPRLIPGRVRFDRAPDQPKPFGYKMAWLAIKTRDTQAVSAALQLDGGVPCNWKSGIGVIYDETLGETRVFVTPPVNGWTFVVGLALPYPVGRSFVDKCTPLLLELGSRFGDVQYYFTYPLIDFYAWCRVVDGRLVRAFAIGDEGIVWNKGTTTRDERQLGLRLFELRGVRDRSGDAGGELLLHPTESHVMQLARLWSLDPTQLDSASRERGLGLIAPIPRSWRPERLRKAA